MKKKSNNALELIMLRNAFYRDSYRRALFALLVLLVVNAVLGLGIFYKTLRPQSPLYFPTTADGRIIQWHPLSQPVVSDDFVLQWSANAVRKSFSWDFEHWRSQLQSASQDFTPSGWHYFLASLKKSNNLKTLRALKMVSNAQITGAPRVLAKEVIDGVYAWKVQMPILVTFANAHRTIPMAMRVTLIVMRVPVKNYPARIAINNFLPVVEQTAQQRLMSSGI